MLLYRPIFIRITVDDVKNYIHVKKISLTEPQDNPVDHCCFYSIDLGSQND